MKLVDDVKDIRESWFMRQHFSKDELEQLYQWEKKSGKICDIIPTEGGFNLFHIEDKDHKINLVFMEGEEQVRIWGERLGYSFKDKKKATDEYSKSDNLDKIIWGYKPLR